ncbi:hypothetical protein PV10_01556 [Exophiala mesophila]|uniref:Uncharacterized protein n=1 Tax=Exophiala mesophila TaxID=212818 RepID=A0A0D1YB42_EXOME|nr:uncharacterized protein PV10_01556 [Exophiala mesophila]KIV97851.1 hypothetical protein PV10_01556 [Exophiala mesophila]
MASTPTQQTIYIVYSNSTKFFGQLAYGIRRMSTTVGSTPCPALELTHGGLSTTERPEWVEAKKSIPIPIQQLHYDEIPSDLKKFIESNKYEYPCVVAKGGTSGRFNVLLADSEISDYAEDPAKFVKILEYRAVQAGLTWTK